MQRLIVKGIATLGVGQIKWAPGTFGSLLAVVIWWLLLPCPWWEQFLLIVLAFIVGWVGTHYYEKWNERHDPKEVVVDELIGMWITLFAAPRWWGVFVLGFLLFRLFDIWKPFPIGWVDRKVPGAFGTLMDDVIAAVFAHISLNLLLVAGRYFGILNL